MNNDIISIISGSLGGITQILIGHPLDTIKVRMQTTTNNKMLDVIKEICKDVLEEI